VATAGNGTIYRTNTGALISERAFEIRGRVVESGETPGGGQKDSIEHPIVSNGELDGAGSGSYPSLHLF
jgi:hypothetical protein